MFFIILTVIISIIGLLVFHEFGHFIVAKKFGVKVKEFGVGYPPRILGKKFGETLYSINLIPFGAFVRIPGADEEEDMTEAPERRYTEKPIWQKSLIILGGVISFWVASIVLLSVVFATGFPQSVSDEETGLVDPKVQVLAVYPGTPAEESGIKLGDVIIRIKNQKGEKKEIQKVSEVQEITGANKGEELVLTILRGKKSFETTLIPRTSHPNDEGPMGISLVRTAEKKYPLWQAPIKGVEGTLSLTGAVIEGWYNILSSLFKGEGMPKGVQLVGPIGIGSILTQAAQVGMNHFLQFIALIAVYLAIFNLLPIPALDGGKLLFLMIEKIKGTPVNQRLEQRLSTIVFLLLIFVMALVTIKDIIRLF